VGDGRPRHDAVTEARYQQQQDIGGGRGTHQLWLVDVHQVVRRPAAAAARALAERTGRSYGFVRRILGESGVQLRDRGGATRSKKET
jgi:hypothetical protein